MTITDLILYGSTCLANKEDVRQYLTWRLYSALRPYVSDPRTFLQHLNRTGSIISGSFALSVFVPSRRDGWKANDMDIYSNPDLYRELMSFLQSVGYQEQTDPVYRSIERYLDRPGIREVHKLVHRDSSRTIDLIVTTSVFVEGPIFRYHSTAVMNWITGSGFFSAYPQLTAKRRSLLNPLTFVFPDVPPRHVVKCLTKYAKRGFSLRLRPSAWADDAHSCRRSPICPHTLRSTTDTYCLQYKYAKEGDRKTDYDQFSTSTTDMVGLTWKLGGLSCDGVRPPVRSHSDLFPRE